MRPMWEYELVTPPAADPVDLAEAKSACRVLHDDEDAELQMLIAAAVALLDGPTGYLGQAIIDQEWTVRCSPDGVSGDLALPFGPVSDVVSIKTHNGTELVNHDLAGFRILKGKFKTTITPVSGGWPSMARRGDALQIQFKAGAADAASVPATIKQAIRMLVAHWYRNREAVMAGGGGKEAEFALQALLVNERRI